MYKFNMLGRTPQSELNGCVAFKNSSIGVLDAKFSNTTALELFFGDSVDYLTRLYYTPINMFNYENGIGVGINVKTEDFPVGAVIRGSNKYYYCGTYKYKGNDYRDYEPYTSCEVYLPYYGLTNIPMKYLNKYHITFLLAFSPQTGEATYIITADSRRPLLIDVTSPKMKAFWGNYNLQTEFVIKKLKFNAAMDVPITNTGVTEMLRNVSLSAMSTGIGLITADIASGSPITTMASITKTQRGHTVMTEQARNTLTNKLIQTTKQTLDYEPDVTVRTSAKYRDTTHDIVGTIGEGINSAIRNIHMKPDVEKIHNTFLQVFDDLAIHIYITRQKYKSVSTNLSPKPCLVNGKLNSVFDITELGITHFNTYNKYVTPKTNEIDNINEMLKGQLICRPYPTGKSIILGDNFSKELLYNKSIFENLNDVDDVINNNGMINVNGYRIYHNHIPVRYDDFPSTRKYFIANLPLGQDTFNLSFDFCNNVIPNIAPNTYWEDIVNTNDITSVDGKIHINAKFNNVTNIDIPISYNNRILAVEEKDMIIPSESKTTYEAYEGYVKPLKVITNDGEKLFYFGEMSEWNVFILDPTYNREIGYGYLYVFSASNGYVFYKGNPLFYNGKAVRDTDTIKDFNTPYTS